LDHALNPDRLRVVGRDEAARDLKMRLGWETVASNAADLASARNPQAATVVVHGARGASSKRQRGIAAAIGAVKSAVSIPGAGER